MKFFTYCLLFLFFCQTYGQKTTVSSTISGHSPSTGYHVSQKTIEFNVDLYNFEVDNISLASRIRSNEAQGLSVDGKLYTPNSNISSSWFDYVTNSSNAIFKISGEVIVNGELQYQFSSEAYAAEGFTSTGSIDLGQNIIVRSVDFRNIRIVSQEIHGLDTFRRHINTREDTANDNSNSNNNSNNGNDGTNNSSNSSSTNGRNENNSSTGQNETGRSETYNRESNSNIDYSEEYRKALAERERRMEQEKQQKMNEAAVAGAHAVNAIFEANGDDTVSYWTLMGGIGWADSDENIDNEFSTYSASILHHGKGKFLAHEVGLKYSDNFYYQSIGVPFGLGLGFGSDNTGLLLMGGADLNYMFSYNEEYEAITERLEDEYSEITNPGMTFNCSGTIYYGVQDVGLTLKLTYYFLEAAVDLANNEDNSVQYPNPFPGMHLSFGITL